MLHRIISRVASALLVAALLAVPATAGAKAHHKRHVARHHVVKHHKATHKSVGRSDNPVEPSHEEPSGDAPSGSDDPVEPSHEPDPAPGPSAQSDDAGTVVSFGEGVLDIELGSGGHVTGRVIQGGTQYACRSLSTGQPVTEGCNASLLTAGRGVHEFSVNYGPAGAWFQRIIIVLP